MKTRTEIIYDLPLVYNDWKNRISAFVEATSTIQQISQSDCVTYKIYDQDFKHKTIEITPVFDAKLLKPVTEVRICQPYDFEAQKIVTDQNHLIARQHLFYIPDLALYNTATQRCQEIGFKAHLDLMRESREYTNNFLSAFHPKTK